MPTAFITVRGHMSVPHLLEVDLQSGALLRTIELPPAQMGEVPPTKGGTSGLHRSGDHLFVATWDTVNVVEAASGKVVEQVSDRHFSDLHGVFVEDDGTLWITSTNLDGVYKWKNGQVEPFFHAWEQREQIGNVPTNWKAPQLEPERDYRLLTKEKSAFHGFHINSVWVTKDQVILSFLGLSRKTPPPSLLERGLKRLHLHRPAKTFYKHGGLLVLNKSGNVLRTIWTEGLHDPGLGRDGALYYSVYFGDALLRLDLCTFETRLVPLQAPDWKTWGYLTRGVLDDGEAMWVGATQHRSWSREGWNPNSMAYLRSYDRDGQWAGGHVWLPGYVGVYAMVSGG